MAHRMPDKVLEHVIQGRRYAEFVKHIRKDLVADAFTVDQNAVAIKNDQLEFCHWVSFGDSDVGKNGNPL